MNQEYIFKTATLIEWQKWFNQWKHNYQWIIHHMVVNGDHATILMERWDKKS